MLDKVFKIAGIIAFVAIVVAGISIMYDVFGRSSHSAPPDLDYTGNTSQRPLNPQQKATMQAEGEVIKSMKVNDKLILLLRISNPSDRSIRTHSLSINIVSSEGEIIDQCTMNNNTFSHLSSMIRPKKIVTRKVICSDMVFIQDIQESTDSLKYEIHFSADDY